MKTLFISLFSIILLISIYCSKKSAQQYEFYNPDIERQQISFPEPGRQHHDATIAWFKDRWIAQYDDHVVPKGVPQYIHQRTSFDFKTWTPEINVYTDSAGSVNPIQWQKDIWQPGFVNVGDELWSFWSVSGLQNLYFSRLADPAAKWQNQSLPFKGLFISNGGVILSNGWVAVPVTRVLSVAESGKAKVLPEDTELNSDHFIYTTDNGKSWHLSAGTQAHQGPTWEASIWEPKQGEIWMVARNIGTKTVVQKTPMTETAGYNVSLDFGKTWVYPKRQVLPLEVSNSRPHVVNDGERNILAHNDYYTPSLNHWEHRYNMALYFNRGRGVNFVAGPVIDKRMSEYPQICIHNDQAIVIYSAREHVPSTAPEKSKDLKDRFIMVARLDLPKPDGYYLFARTARGKIDKTSVDGRQVLRFHDNYSSAGIDVDENDSRKDEVYLTFCFKIESPEEQAVFTIGYPPIQLVVKDNQVILASESDSVNVGTCQDWTTAELISKPDKTLARIDNGDWKQLDHPLDKSGRWLYFGQGYYKKINRDEARKPEKGRRFLIDVGSVKTTVKAVSRVD